MREWVSSWRRATLTSVPLPPPRPRDLVKVFSGVGWGGGGSRALLGSTRDSGRAVCLEIASTDDLRLGLACTDDCPGPLPWSRFCSPTEAKVLGLGCAYRNVGGGGGGGCNQSIFLSGQNRHHYPHHNLKPQGFLPGLCVKGCVEVSLYSPTGQPELQF